MKHLLWVVGISVLVFSVSHATEIVRWERIPLAIGLFVGQERVVFVERNVRVGMPDELRERLRVQSTGGALYLRADAPIEPTRIQLQDTATGELILLDISAQPAASDQVSLEPLLIVTNDEPQESARAEGSLGKTEAKRTPVPVVLTRYASQSLYAPLRTVEPVAGISMAPVPSDSLTTLLPNLAISAHALGAWRLDDFWVTAVRLANTGTQAESLDPRDLQGNFLAATFQHRGLGPAGDSTDTTVVYLVTKGHGLAGALLPNLSPFDASGNSALAPKQSEPAHEK